jgi:hypothetical protein
MAGGPFTATNVASQMTIPNLGAQQRFLRVRLIDP